MEGNWKDKLEKWAPEPPQDVWDRISEQLTETSQPHFAQKLCQYSEAPPATTWNAIAAQLDAPRSAPIVSLLSKSRLTRYGSIAASLLFCFFLFWQYSPRGGKRSDEADKMLQKQNTIPLPGEIGDLGPNQNSTSRETKEGTDVGATTSFASISPMPLLHIDKTPMPTIRAERTNSVRIYDLMPAATHDLDDGYVERYIVIPVAEDAAVRVPKKLYDLFRCGDVPIPSGCSELVAQIRQQSAAPSFVSTADFSGLLELLQQVELHQ